MTDEPTTECEAFAAVVNAVLDGDAPASDLVSPHTLACHQCRELAAAARLLASTLPELQSLPLVPAELAQKLVASMRGRRRPWAPALTAWLVISAGLWVFWPTRPEGVAGGRPAPLVNQTSPNTDRATKSTRVYDHVAAVTAVAQSTSEKASAPARLLTDFNLHPPPAFQREWSDAAFAPLEKASRTTAEPVADTARRAVGLFLRDFGLTPKPAG